MKTFDKAILLVLFSLVYAGLTVYIFTTIPESNTAYYLGWLAVTYICWRIYVRMSLEVFNEINKR